MGVFSLGFPCSFSIIKTVKNPMRIKPIETMELSCIFMLPPHDTQQMPELIKINSRPKEKNPVILIVQKKKKIAKTITSIVIFC